MGNHHSEAGQLHKESRLAASKFDSFEIHFLQVYIIFSYCYYYYYYDSLIVIMIIMIIIILIIIIIIII